MVPAPAPVVYKASTICAARTQELLGLAHDPCPPITIITQAPSAKAHTRRKKPNRVFMQNPYRPIIIKFATKVTTFFRLCPRGILIPSPACGGGLGRGLEQTLALSLGRSPLPFPLPQGGEGDVYAPRPARSRLFHKEYRIPEASKRIVTPRLMTAGTFSMPNISAARTLPPMKINTTAKLYFR